MSCWLPKGALLSGDAIRANSEAHVKSLRIKTPTIEEVVAQLSGGNKQKVVIGKWVNTDAEIYIFDDSFSALYYRTDQSLREALRRETAGATCLIVAQRIGTIRDADKIVVLEEGRAVGIGTHRELMRNCEVYREIAYSQLSEEELKDA